MSPRSSYSLALEKRPVGHGSVEIVDAVDYDYLAQYHPWPEDYLDLVVAHFQDKPIHPGVVVLLYHIRKALGATGMLWANCSTPRTARAAFRALTMTGSRRLYTSSDRRLSCWTGEWWHEKEDVGPAVEVGAGDLPLSLAQRVLRLIPKTAQVVELFPTHGDFSRAAVTYGLQPTIVVKPETSARDRLISSLDSRKR